MSVSDQRCTHPSPNQQPSTDNKSGLMVKGGVGVQFPQMLVLTPDKQTWLIGLTMFSTGEKRSADVVVYIKFQVKAISYCIDSFSSLQLVPLSLHKEKDKSKNLKITSTWNHLGKLQLGVIT